MNKIILHILKDDGEIKEIQEFKSIKALSEAFPCVEYYQWREFYKYLKDDKAHNQLQSVQRELYKHYRVIDNPLVLKRISSFKNH
jgi:hypothetical protein